MAIEQRTPRARRRPWRTAAALAVGAGLALGAGLAVGAGAAPAAAPPRDGASPLAIPPDLPATEAAPAPAVGLPRLVLADDGRVGASVPVAYGRGSLPAGARLAGEVAVRVLVPRRGAPVAEYSAGPQALGLRSTDRLVDHHPLWLGGGEGAGAALQAALAAEGSAALVEVRARVAVDADGAFEAARGSVDSTGVDELTPPERLAAGLVGATPDADPCSKYNVPNCVNARGGVWEAEGFWHSNTQQVLCPSDHPYTYGNAWGFDTTSQHYTDAGIVVRNEGSDYPIGWLLTATDDNAHGHPYAYTPVIACVVTLSAST